MLVEELRKIRITEFETSPATYNELKVLSGNDFIEQAHRKLEDFEALDEFLFLFRIKELTDCAYDFPERVAYNLGAAATLLTLRDVTKNRKKLKDQLQILEPSNQEQIRDNEIMESLDLLLEGSPELKKYDDFTPDINDFFQRLQNYDAFNIYLHSIEDLPSNLSHTYTSQSWRPYVVGSGITLLALKATAERQIFKQLG